MSPETAVERFNIEQGFYMNANNGGSRPARKVNIKRCSF